MENIFADIPLWVLLIACLTTVIAGFVKGAIGFAMPMIMISGLATVLSAEAALAALILPTVMTNAAQALRQGLRAALQSAWRFRLYLSVVLIFIMGSAQLVTIMPRNLMFLMIGVPVALFSLTQILGWHLSIKKEHHKRAEVMIGCVAGFSGGLSGIWGPPTVAFLTAIETEKREQIRVQGVIYGAGAIVLLIAHIKSGVFTASTGSFSALMMVPAFLGMVLGMRVQDRLDQAKFKKATLIVLTIAGLNLIRRGLVG